MEDAAKKTAGVKDAVVNFMTQKMTVEFEEDGTDKAVMKEVLKNCKKVEDDCEIYL
jgi:cation transport ATPase